MSTIVWNISQMDCYPQAEGEADVVFTVHWQCHGTQEQDGNAYNGSVSSICGVTYSAGSPYTPYADLTQDQVFGWIWASGVDKDAIEAAVQQQIDNAINPPVVTPPLPWTAPAA
jgi:hypothetical protein